ncbi:methionyl-tRNA synthetase, partial [Nowakowskiella sp. JEL0078]
MLYNILAPHIGHLYSSVLADIMKRWYEFIGRESYLCTGTDEHGLKIQNAARDAKTDPKSFCDSISTKFLDLCEASNISQTDFIRTTEKRHYDAVTKRLKESGYIYKGKHEGWYCVSDETFYPVKQVIEVDGNMISKETGKKVEWTSEENYKFRLSNMRVPLLNWIKSNPDVILPKSRYDEIVSTLEGEIADLSISRPKSRLQWGIPVPDDEDHVIYVWMDALTNYLTVCGFPNSLIGWPADWHVVGKDIIKFHSIYWPAFLLAANLEPPKRILVHAHWLLNRTKMSKSLGNVVDPFLLLENFGADPIRYFLARDGGITDDSEFSINTIEKRYRKDLAGQLGNLLMRCTAPKINPFQIVPSRPVNLSDVDLKLLEK